MAGVFPMDDVVLDGEGPENMNGHDNFSDDDCIEVRRKITLIQQLIFYV